MHSIHLKSAAVRTLLAATLVCAATATHATATPAVRDADRATPPATSVAISPGLGTLSVPWWPWLWLWRMAGAEGPRPPARTEIRVGDSRDDASAIRRAPERPAACG